MKKRYSISFFVAIIACVTLLSFAYRTSYDRTKEQAQTEHPAVEEERENSVPVEGNAEKADVYYLKNLNGFIAVYLGDKKTLYEYTSIPMNGLPEDIAVEIENWKPIETQERLYSFLESYSS